MADFMAEKVVQPAANPELAAYCPMMDLIALTTIDKQVHVFRLNGQKVFGVSSRSEDGEVNQIRWKPNGQVLAVALDGHELTLTNSHTGKKLHRIDCSKFSKSQISCLGWGVTFTESASLSQRLQQTEGAVTLEDVISRNPSIKNIEIPPDLPSDLAFLDVESCLPKLSPLPSVSIEDDLFSTRASMDSIFDTPVSSSMDAADVLVVGFEDGTVHLSIYDFFEIGTFKISPPSRNADPARPLLHCFHPYSTTHTLLASVGNELMVVPIDLRLISSAGRYLPFLASKATRLQNLLRYLHQVQRQLHADFRASQDLPKRFIRNIEEDLKSKSDCTWEQAAYHLVVTGNCFPEVKEWMVDQLGERGYKRWDKAVTTGYESVQRLLHEHLLPALERFTVVASRLRGISKFQASNANLGLSTLDLDNILDTVSSLQLVAHHLLVIATTEFEQFRAFSVWLHQEIDIQSTEEPNVESLEKGPDVDHIRALKYIQGAMTQSQLVDFLESKPDVHHGTQWDLNAEGRSLFELYKRELNLNREKPTDEKVSSKQLPGLKDLLDHLDKNCNAVFNKIGETQRRNIRFASSISLGGGVSDKRDLRMIVERPDNIEEVSLYVAVASRLGRGDVRIYRITFVSENGMSTTKLIECASLQTADWSVDDIKFVDDEEIMLAMSNDQDSCLFRVRYRQNRSEHGALRYDKIDDAQELSASIDFSDPDQAAQQTWLEFPRGESWAAERIEVNGRKGRRAVCVFARDRLRYRIYDLDGGVEAGEGDGADGQSDTVMHE